ncbi:MAG: ATP-binding protein [Halanaeroarchaeum sp.]
MATTVFHLLVFTALPLAVLLMGMGLSIGYSYLLGDRRILLATLLFALMASHQSTEVVQWFAGGNPHRNLLGEIFETSVNLLAVGTIVYVVWSLREERRVRESLAEFQGTILGNRPQRPTGSSEERGDPFGGLGALVGRSERLSTVAGGLADVLPFGQRSHLDQVLEAAIENARLTFPIATFEREPVDPVEVVADSTYLQEVIEILLEQLVLYNDKSDPVIAVSVERERGGVFVRFTHNGSGLPENVRALLESHSTDTSTDVAELVFVETFVTKWGGDIEIGTEGDETAVVLRLATPRFGG